MSREDLDICWLPHATSKISSEDDLYNIRTLGFRGEALSSIAAVSRMEIVSSETEGIAYRLFVNGGKSSGVEPWRGKKGTIIDVADLFYSLPGRKNFLKRNSAEMLQCKTTFIEKALPFPGVSFKFFSDGELKLFLPASDLTSRICSVYQDQLTRDLMHEIQGTSENFSIRAVTGSPDIFRKDRKLIQIFVNNRRITEFVFVQAVEYAFSEYMPGGRFPVSFVFIEISPQLVDFNIHPAKREVKIRDLQSIHHRLVEIIRSFLSAYMMKFRRSPELSKLNMPAAEFPYIPPQQTPARMKQAEAGYHQETPSFVAERHTAFPLEKLRGSTPFKERDDESTGLYLGQLFGLFLLVEREDRFFLIDQHAAHERILFDTFISSPPRSQRLLIPYEFDVSEDEGAYLEARLDDFKKLGVEFERSSEKVWAVTAVHDSYRTLLSEIVDFARGTEGEAKDLGRNFIATMACRSAVKDGDMIDRHSALAIIRGAFSLEHARCPHGRPVWVEFSRERLFQLVGRL